MKRIAVLTSGGDAPGMNAALRAVVRMGIYSGLEVVGVRRGYTGLIRGDMIPMSARSVANIVQRGGTILNTDRCEEFLQPEGRARAVRQLRAHNIDGLVVIGGDGSFRGAHSLHEEHDLAVVGVPGTIDNDVYGTDWTIGFDTGVNNALDAIDKIRDTAASHERVFLVEVMGRHSGFIALWTGVASGAEVITLPEEPTDIQSISGLLNEGKDRGKSSGMIVVAEGDEAGGAFELAARLREATSIVGKVVVLGHIQRGGNPTARDRILASRLGADAVQALVDGESDVMIGSVDHRPTRTPLKDSFTKKHDIDRELVELAKVLTI